MHENNTPTKESRPCEYCSLGCTTQIYGVNLHLSTYVSSTYVSSKHLTLHSAPPPHPYPRPPHPHTHTHTHPPPPFWQTTFSNCIFLNENDIIPIQISFNYAPRSPIDNKPALVQVTAWRRTGDKPLPEPMMTQFNDAYMRH